MVLSLAITKSDSRYEKDWIKPVDPNKMPKLDEAKLKTYPAGYRYISYLALFWSAVLTLSRYLSYCQEETMPGIKLLLDLPGHRRENDNVNGKAHDALYVKCRTWVEGGMIEI